MFGSRSTCTFPPLFRCLIVVAALGATDARSQQLVAIAGSISDATGGAIAGATVDAVVADRITATATTGTDGRYQIRVPARSSLQLRVHRQGFSSQTLTLAGPSADTISNVTLQVGPVSDALVVTAARGWESLSATTSATAVLTAEQIRSLGSSSLADVLRFVPGLAAEGTGREGAMTSLFARGGESDYNLVLIDGVRVNQSGGAFDFSRIAAGEIQRVEIVRGAQSSLWGSDAMGAVIQVFTRPEATRALALVSGNVEGGSFDTVRSDAGVSGIGSRGDYSATLVRRRTGGAFENRLRERDRFEQMAVSLSGGVAMGNRATLRGGARVNDSDGANVGNIVFGVSDTGAVYESRDESWHLALAHTMGARYTGSATVNGYRLEMRNADRFADPSVNVYALLEGRPGAQFPGSPRLVRLLTQPEFASLQAGGHLGTNQFLATTPFGIGDFASNPLTEVTRFQRAGFRYQGDLMARAADRTSVGYEYERETNPLVPLFELNNHAVFVQHRVAIGDRWSVSAGARVDDKSMYEAFFSPKLSVGGTLLPARSGPVSSARVFFNIGKGIKSPTFAERFGGSFADGNANLNVERARSADAGVEMTFASQRVRAGATWFHNQFHDQVEFRSTSPSFSLDGQPDFINVAGSRATGLELEAALQRSLYGVTALASYTLTDTEVQDTVLTGVQFQPGQPLLRRPKHAGALQVMYERGRVSLNANTRFVGQRHDAAFLSLRTVPNANFPNAVTTDITVNPGYTVLGLGVDVRAHEGLSLFARTDNVGDTVYQSALGYPGLPRSFWAGARVTLGR